MYHHILMCADLTEGSETVMRKAWMLANQFDAKMSLLHVIEPIQAYGYPGVVEIEATLIEQAKKDLDTLCEECSVAVVDQHIEVGPTKREIIKIAEDLKVDLIVVGSHGRHGISRLLGSTANAILHSAHCDVLTVRMVE